jgi:hypothetical protein
MDLIYKNDGYKLTVRDENQCFITHDDAVYAMSLRGNVQLPPVTVPVHVIDLPKPLTIVPEPVVEFTIAYPPDVAPKMQVNDLLVLIYKVPCCVGFVGSINTEAHTATILPIAVNMSRGAIVFVDVLPETADTECLYILKSANTAYAFWDGQWHMVGTDVTEFQKALNIHANNQALHVSPTERRKWSSGGNFAGTFDTYADFTASPTYQTAQVGDFVLLRHSAENDAIAIYTVRMIENSSPQWYRAHLWDNAGGKYVGSFANCNLLPESTSRGDFALVGNDFYVMAAKWELSHALQVRDFEAEPIRAYETDDSILKVPTIVDTLDSTSRSRPLSANMGRELSLGLMPQNAYQHLFNFGFLRSSVEARQDLFTQSNTGPTNLLQYTYQGALPKWASLCYAVTREDVALFHRSGSIFMRLDAKTADTASMTIGNYPVVTDINMLGILWIYTQVMFTPMFLMLPGMKIIAGLYDPHESQWPLVKESDTGEHKLEGYIKLYIHSA